MKTGKDPRFGFDHCGQMGLVENSLLVSMVFHCWRQTNLLSQLCMVAVSILGSARVSARFVGLDLNRLVISSVNSKLGCGLQESTVLIQESAWFIRSNDRG